VITTQAKKPMNTRLHLRDYAQYGALSLAALGYFTPWVWHKSAAFTLQGYDLAEWLSLLPNARAGILPLLLPLLVRSVLALLAVLFALAAARQRNLRWLPTATAGALGITLLPPPAFLRNTGDPNYQQQFMLAVITLLVLVGVASMWPAFQLPRARRRLEIALAALAITCTLIGAALGLTAVGTYVRGTVVGVGVLLALVGLLVYVALILDRPTSVYDRLRASNAALAAAKRAERGDKR
jgi:hypothetical protein